MPIYVYNCICGAEKETFRQIKDIEDPVPCECGRQMERIIQTPVYKDFQPYYDEHLACDAFPDGTYVKSARHKKEMMKKAGLEHVDKKGENHFQPSARTLGVT